LQGVGESPQAAVRLSGVHPGSPDHRTVRARPAAETFELYGFASIETRAVEPLDRLGETGEIDKEVYTVQRLHGENGPADLGLHFDLTVPFARYVLENAHQLAFPSGVNQIQRCGEASGHRKGRYREFTQADIDIIDAERWRRITTSRCPVHPGGVGASSTLILACHRC
jgi:histidyl-tRNA synthetase